MKKLCFLIVTIFVFSSLAFADNYFGIYSDTTYPLTATSAQGQATKVGTSTNSSYLWGALSLGNLGIDQAVKNGKISEIKYVELKNKSYIFGLFSVQKTVVYGK